jgi:hypothetical protein
MKNKDEYHELSKKISAKITDVKKTVDDKHE